MIQDIPNNSTVFVAGKTGYWTVTGFNSGTLVYSVTSDDGTVTTALIADLTLTTRPGPPYVTPDVTIPTDSDLETRVTALEEQVRLLSQLLGVPYES